MRKFLSGALTVIVFMLWRDGFFWAVLFRINNPDEIQGWPTRMARWGFAPVETHRDQHEMDKYWLDNKIEPWLWRNRSERVGRWAGVE